MHDQCAQITQNLEELYAIEKTADELQDEARSSKDENAATFEFQIEVLRQQSIDESLARILDDLVRVRTEMTSSDRIAQSPLQAQINFCGFKA